MTRFHLYFGWVFNLVLGFGLGRLLPSDLSMTLTIIVCFAMLVLGNAARVVLVALFTHDEDSPL